MRPAEQSAHDLLTTAWRTDADGCFVVPVDPFAIAGSSGLKVTVTPLDENVSGMLRKLPGQDAEIFVNALDHPHRQRFSCAHEIGHFDMRFTSARDDSWGYIDYRGPSAAKGTNLAEIYANQFAAELLMPQGVVRQRAEVLSDMALAAEFHVSPGAMRYRLENLGIR